MDNQLIKVRGARQHNLKNINLDIPKNKFVVFTGVSGSGKSSLAYDTIYAEGQRRYVESLSTYARQFLGIMGKPDVDSIEGLSPAISIDQKTVSHNPRSTVGTVTEIYDYLRLLFARVGHPHCPICGDEIASQSVEQIAVNILRDAKERAKKEGKARFILLSPMVKDRKGEFTNLFQSLRSKGYKKVRIDKNIKDIGDDFVLIKTNRHTIEAVVDRISVTSAELKDDVFAKTLQRRVTDSVEQATKLSDGLILVMFVEDASLDFPENPQKYTDKLYSERFACPKDNIQIPEIEPRTFSFNSPHGACPECLGLGEVLKVNKNQVFAPLLSIKEGGIIPYASIFENDTWLSRLILEVCKVNDIDPNIQIAKLSEESINLILNGTGDKKYKVEGTNRLGQKTYILEEFHGVTGELEKRHKETSSDYIRSALERYMILSPCIECGGKRLKKESLAITIDKLSISDVSAMTVEKSINWLESLEEKNVLSNREKEIGKLITKEILTRLNFLLNVGLDYITLARAAYTLSGGEAQRIRLASQIGTGLTGVLYILDEPTIGLHQRDNAKLIDTLKNLRDLGNTIIVVEHDKDVMKSCDYLFDFGPKAGKNGGLVVSSGTPEEVEKDKNSITGPYLSGKKSLILKTNEKEVEDKKITLKGVSAHNLKEIDVDFPLGKLVVVTGVSGSGKSTLIVDTLYHALAKKLHKYHPDEPGSHKDIVGYDNVDKVILIDQSPIGRTPRSNPATYTKVFDGIRDVFAMLKEAKAMGFKKGRFSFNVKGGRCESCEGQGKVKIEMQFMPDIWVDCEVCHGTRYNSQTLEVTYNGKNIADVLSMTVAEGLEFFHAYKPISEKLDTLSEVGLDYMELGQSATTLSGGEAQRIKLATELSKRETGKTVYILDEPTTGLHFADLEKLMKVLKLLVEKGNTVIVVEHNLDVIKNADWIIDLGPEGGEKGGQIVAEGTPKEVASSKVSHTASFLRKELGIK